MHRQGKRTRGLTLIEMTVVIGAIVILVGFGMPALRSLVRSFESSGGTRSMIGAALNSARAAAVQNQRYTGVRFQLRCTSGDPTNPLRGALEAPQYMIFIVHGEPGKMGDLASGFRVMEGAEPIKLPETIGVIDLSEAGIVDYNDLVALNDALTFSVVFSPSGKLTVHDVRTRNRDGEYDPADTNVSADEVFNSPVNIVTHGRGMFVQDDYPAYGLEQEASRTRFVLCDRERLRSAFKQGAVGPGYLSFLTDAETLHVSPHTGTLISSD